jgi:hypothetical protein
LHGGNCFADGLGEIDFLRRGSAETGADFQRAFQRGDNLRMAVT